MKRFWWLFLGLFIVIISGFFYFKHKHNTQNQVGEHFIYNQATQKWEKFGNKDVVSEDRESNAEK